MHQVSYHDDLVVRLWNTYVWAIVVSVGGPVTRRVPSTGPVTRSGPGSSPKRWRENQNQQCANQQKPCPAEGCGAWCWSSHFSLSTIAFLKFENSPLFEGKNSNQGIEKSKVLQNRVFSERQIKRNPVFRNHGVNWIFRNRKTQPFFRLRQTKTLFLF